MIEYDGEPRGVKLPGNIYVPEPSQADLDWAKKITKKTSNYEMREHAYQALSEHNLWRLHHCLKHDYKEGFTTNRGLHCTNIERLIEKALTHESWTEHKRLTCARMVFASAIEERGYENYVIDVNMYNIQALNCAKKGELETLKWFHTINKLPLFKTCSQEGSQMYGKTVLDVAVDNNRANVLKHFLPECDFVTAKNLLERAREVSIGASHQSVIQTIQTYLKDSAPEIGDAEIQTETDNGHTDWQKTGEYKIARVEPMAPVMPDTDLVTIVDFQERSIQKAFRTAAGEMTGSTVRNFSDLESASLVDEARAAFEKQGGKVPEQTPTSVHQKSSLHRLRQHKPPTRSE